MQTLNTLVCIKSDQSYIYMKLTYFQITITYRVKFLILFICCCLIAGFTKTYAQQDVTGEWYGVGYVKKNGEHNSYLAEMILKQKGNKVTGTFSYYFKTDSFSANIKGVYHEDKRWLELNSTPILNYIAKNKNGADCAMEGDFTLMASLLETTLTGQFNPTYADRLLCPAITIKFVKYIPDTAKQAQTEIDEEDTIESVKPIIKQDTVKQIQPVKPIIKDTTRPVIVKVEPKKTDTVAIAIRQDTIKANIVMRDTLKSGRAIVSSKDSLKNVPVVIKRPVNPNEKYIRELYRRTFELVTPVMEVEADSLTVSFYDNGEIDNDTISVFYNRKPVLLSQMLSGKPITLKLRLDTAINEISMFAENLGRIPPNTAVAIIYAGGQRYELNLSSSLMTNATVRFRKKPKPKDPKNIN